jgi:hypothetical protein
MSHPNQLLANPPVNPNLPPHSNQPLPNPPVKPNPPPHPNQPLTNPPVKPNPPPHPNQPLANPPPPTLHVAPRPVVSFHFLGSSLRLKVPSARKLLSFLLDLPLAHHQQVML